jgi:hypothetical protein
MAKKGKSSSLEVDCPHCGATLTVDPELAAVIAHEPPPDKKYDFDEQLKGLSEAERKREELFREQMAAVQAARPQVPGVVREGQRRAGDQAHPRY